MTDPIAVRVVTINERAAVPATLQEVLRADTLASGHVDYQRKIALYCAELAERRQPALTEAA